MIYLKRKFLLLGLCLLVQSCTLVDDYMLGKDNTIKPTPLTEIKPKLNLVENWSVITSKPSKSSSYLKLKPVVKGNIIYIANESGKVDAVNKDSGKIIWSKQLPNSIISGPSVAHGYIALGTNRSTVILLRESDGEQLHKFKTSGEALSKPAIISDKIIIKTIDGYLYGFDLKTGKKLWGAEHGSPSLILKASSSPIIVNKLAIVGFSDGKLDAIDTETGRIIWQRSIAYASGSSDVERLVDIDADPIIRGDIAYLASYQGYIGALSLTDGQFIWRKAGSVYKNMTVDSSTLYITDSNDVLWALNRNDGKVKWKQVALKGRGLTEPTILGNRLVVGDRSGFLHVLSTSSGEFIARKELNGAIDISPAISGNSIYVMTANGNLSKLTAS